MTAAVHARTGMGTFTADELSLRTAAETGDSEALVSCVTGGNGTGNAEVNTRFAGGVTALMLAAQRGDTEFVKLLLLFGAKASMLDDNGHAASWHAKCSRHGLLQEMLEYASSLA